MIAFLKAFQTWGMVHVKTLRQAFRECEKQKGIYDGWDSESEGKLEGRKIGGIVYRVSIIRGPVGEGKD